MASTSAFTTADSSSLLEVFFTVRDLDSAMARLTELGGQRVSEVHAENAAFGTWVECRDDQGVRFGLRQPPGGPWARRTLVR